MGYAFISYSTKNQTSADAFKALLDRNNIPNWMAPYDIPVGKNYPEVIIQVLKDCSCLILLLSNDAMHSLYVPREVERAIGYNKPIFPAQLENVTLTDEFEFYISRNQIIAINKIDESSPEIQQLLANVCTACGEIYHTSDVRSYSTPVTPFSTFASNTSAGNASAASTMKSAEPPLHVGDVIGGKYRIEEYLAQFDSYHLYISYCPRINKKFFIKVYREDNSHSGFSPNIIEATMLKSLDQTSLARLLDIIHYEDLLLTVFEFPEGDFLSDLISLNLTFSENELVNLGIELCDALSYLATKETKKGIHRISPNNIIRKSPNAYCLLDFYQRATLSQNSPDNKPNSSFYYAPEILNGAKDFDFRADIYSIGATLYSVATQNDPTQAPYVIYPLHSRRPDISAGLAYIINKCMETDPEKRYDSFGSLLMDLYHVDKLTKKLTQKNFFKELFKKNKK